MELLRCAHLVDYMLANKLLNLFRQMNFLEKGKDNYIAYLKNVNEEIIVENETLKNIVSNPKYIAQLLERELKGQLHFF